MREPDPWSKETDEELKALAQEWWDNIRPVGHIPLATANDDAQTMSLKQARMIRSTIKNLMDEPVALYTKPFQFKS